MTRLITEEEIIALAKLSHIHLEQHDIVPLTTEIEDVLKYAAFLKDFATKYEEQPLVQNVNILREDKAVAIDTEPLLALAPERERNYFVVPVIVKQ